MSVVVVPVTVEVDMITVPGVQAGVEAALASGAAVVVVDLTAVSFFACAGLRMLVELRRAAGACGVDLCVAAAGRAVLHPMRITGFLDSFPVHESVGSAVAATLRSPALNN